LKNFKQIVILGVAIGIGAALYFYWQYTAAHPTSDDSYVQADTIDIAPQTSGLVLTVDVAENDYVERGDTLFTIDAATHTAARMKAEAELEQARQAERQSAANIAAAEAALTQANAALNDAQNEFARQAPWADDGTISPATMDKYQTALDEAIAGQKQAQAALEAARAEHGQDGELNAGVRSAEAYLALTDINLGYTTVTAPTSGWISNISLRPGAYVSAGSSQFSIVSDENWWVEANFKETDLTSIRPGMPASISIDMYPSLDLQGTVGSIAAGSGASFSLIAAENATGNWIKVTQRFPVRILLREVPKDPDRPLRLGASATVQVDTTADKR
jgi:membrane fusion protein (multidrug efflux system)